jgi:hypothetical protein
MWDNGAVTLDASSRLLVNPRSSLAAPRYSILEVRTYCPLRLSPSFTLDYSRPLELGHNPLNHASLHSWAGKWRRARGAAVSQQPTMLELLLFCTKSEDCGNIIITITTIIITIILILINIFI